MARRSRISPTGGGRTLRVEAPQVGDPSFTVQWRIGGLHPGSLFRGHAFLAAVEEAHHTMAERVQEDAVAILRERVAATGRPQLEDAPREGREANRLQRSLLDPENAFSSPAGFGVGIPAWLDRSPAALYWRIIEEGGQGYTTRGLFFPPGAPVPGSPAEPPRPYSKSAIMFAQFPRGIATHIGATPAYRMLNVARRHFLARQWYYDVYQDKVAARGFPLEFGVGKGRRPGR